MPFFKTFFNFFCDFLTLYRDFLSFYDFFASFFVCEILIFCDFFVTFFKGVGDFFFEWFTLPTSVSSVSVYWYIGIGIQIESLYNHAKVLIKKSVLVLIEKNSLDKKKNGLCISDRCTTSFCKESLNNPFEKKNLFITFWKAPKLNIFK